MTNKTKIQQLRANNPELKAADIAKQLGISAEAVRQQLVRLGLQTRIYKKPKCDNFCSKCGREY